MTFSITTLLTFIGSLGLFLYGMKLMSEALQKVAGSKMRSILTAMTRNRFMGILTGVLVTAIIQSSSATTVMVVSFVNAGLMTLSQSIGVIMGANIGTTVTAWIISAIGFKVDIAAFAIPLFAIGMPLIFSNRSNRKSYGEFIFGFSFLFMGLSFLQKGAIDMNFGEAVADMLAHIQVSSFLSILMFVFVGAVVTMVVQASAATMAITLMLFDMHIPGFGFEQAAALAMGQNIGTTITAFMASLTANTQARRAALAHMFFNVFGVIFVLIIFYPACDAVSWFVNTFMGETNEMFKLSAFHTAFNVFNTLLLIGFVKQIEKFVCRVLPQKEQDEEYRLRFISSGILSTAELSILQAQKEIYVYAQRVQKMFGMVKDMDKETNEDKFLKLFERIQKYENISDRMELEIANYLNKVSEGRLSNESKGKIHRMLRIVSEIESIADSCDNLSRVLDRKRQGKIQFLPEIQSCVDKMYSFLDEGLAAMFEVLDLINEPNIDTSKSESIETQINRYRDELKSKNVTDVNAKKYSYADSVVYMDLITECEKMDDYIVNVVEAVSEYKPTSQN
ncbi:MAG: Na/Pi cotransporter family protein [Bacteroidales bacterium]|nr:Na/Pi cotransporter family protein [Bacteroidales bacterium]MBQ6963449.1 Na/Pi cotransporter family protein [Paludibacteraceae bacterium]MBR0498464.1 Na/Pi cotransporter family protein [Paludibacteraceae bacterium]